MGRKKNYVGNLNYEQKKRICQWREESPSLTQNELACRALREFALVKCPAQATILTILKDRERYLHIRDEDKSIRRSRPVLFPELDEALANWVLHFQSRGVMLEGSIVKAKGERLLTKMGVSDDAKMAFSNGWLQSFQQRHGFKSFKAQGESGSVDEASLPERLKKTQQTVRQNALSDIYNFDETGLFYKLCPDKTIAARQIAGSKKSKVRFTVALACDANGSDMREPFFIRHAFKPRYFKKKTAEQLGFLYRNNKKAWMTAILFREWLLNFEEDMKSQKRKVVLLIDNASCHIETGLDLQHVKIIFLPPNTTSKLQPLDAGIIAAVKRLYHLRQLQIALDLEEGGLTRDIYDVDQLLAMRWVKACWRELGCEHSGELVLNCFRHTKIVPGMSSSRRSRRDADELLNGEIVNCMSRLRLRDPMNIDDFVCNPEEHGIALEALTRDDILSEVADVAFIDMVGCESDDDEDQEITENVLPNQTTQQKLDAVRNVIFMLPDHPDLDDKLRKTSESCKYA